MAREVKSVDFLLENPMVPISVAFGAGIAFADYLPLVNSLLFAGFGGGGLYLAGNGKLGKLFGLFGCLAAFLGIGCLAGQMATWKTQPRLEKLFAAPKTATFFGEMGLGQRAPGGKATIPFNVKAIWSGKAWQSVDASLYVRCAADEVPSPGSCLVVRGFYQPNNQERGNPLWAIYRQSLSRQGIAGTLFISKKKDGFTLIRPPSSFNIWPFALKASDRLSGLLDQSLGAGKEAAVAKALLLGNRESLTPELEQAYKTGGAIHLLVVSGGHLALLWSLLYGLLILLPNSWQGRGRWRGRLSIVLVVWGFALVTGLAPTMVRAATMLTLLQIGLVWERPSSGLNALASTAFLILLLYPLTLYSLSFQLSVACVGGLLVLGPRIQALVLPTTWLGRQVWLAFTATLAAQLGALAILLVHFGQFPIWFWLANPPAIMIAYLLLIGQIALLAVQALALIFPLSTIEHVFSNLLWSGLHLLNGWIEAVAALPHALLTGIFISGWQAMVLVVAIILWAYKPARKPLTWARYLAFTTFLWGIVGCLDLGTRASEHHLALGYNAEKGSYFWLAKQGISVITYGVSSPDLERFIDSWRPIRSIEQPYHLSGAYALHCDSLLVVADKKRVSQTKRAPNRQRIYDLARERLFLFPRIEK